jgi:hypothetical protein
MNTKLNKWNQFKHINLKMLNKNVGAAGKSKHFPALCGHLCPSVPGKIQLNYFALLHVLQHHPAADC